MESIEIVRRLMKTLIEDEHPLVTPNFIGTDDEKKAVLGYWSEVIGLMRSMNSIVISHENKLAIIDQLKKELDLIDLEVNNVTSHPVQHPDGSVELSTMPKGQEVPGKLPGVPSPMSNPPAPPSSETVVNLAEPERTQAPVFTRTSVPTSEAMQRLAGTYYQLTDAKRKAAKKK